MSIYTYMFRTEKKKNKKGVCKAQKISCPDWDLLETSVR